MAEKGGKGFPPSTGAKSSLKSPTSNEASLRGKGDSSAKSQKGRKVKFSEDTAELDFNILSKSGGKAGTPISKGDLSKGGKGDKSGSGGKGPVSKEPSVLELKVDLEIPKNAKCLMDCEAEQVLQGIQEQMVILSEDPTIKIPQSFGRGLQYSKRGSHYTNSQSVRRVLESLTKHGATDGEICMIANICPESVDEVFALMPTLKAKRDNLKEPLEDVFRELVKLKHSA